MTWEDRLKTAKPAELATVLEEVDKALGEILSYSTHLGKCGGVYICVACTQRWWAKEGARRAREILRGGMMIVVEGKPYRYVIYRRCAKPCGHCKTTARLTDGKRYEVFATRPPYRPPFCGYVGVRNDISQPVMYSAKHFEEAPESPLEPRGEEE